MMRRRLHRLYRLCLRPLFSSLTREFPPVFDSQPQIYRQDFLLVGRAGGIALCLSKQLLVKSFRQVMI